MEKNTILSLKIAINWKSIKLKTEDTFHTMFIWLITSNHLNLLLRCHWRIVSFVFSLCLFFISFSSLFFSSSFFLLNSHYLHILLRTLTACSSWEEQIYHYNVTKEYFYCSKLTPHMNLYVRTELVLLRDTSSATRPTKTKKNTCCFRIGKKKILQTDKDCPQQF